MGAVALSAVVLGCGNARSIDVVDDGGNPPVGWLAQGDPVPNIMVIPTNGTYEPEVLVECGGPPTFRAGALSTPVLLTESDVADRSMSSLEDFLESGEGDWWPQDGYWALVNTDDVLMMAHIGIDGATTILATERTGAGWMATRAGSGNSCSIQVPLPDGLGEVEWREDPTSQSQPESTSINLVATGRACSSGQPMGDRLTPPQFLVTDDTIYVALVQYGPVGNQTCPGNPEEAVTVELGEPRGARPIINARNAAGTLADYLPVSPCGHVDPGSFADTQPLDEPVALDGPPERTTC